MMKIFKSKRYKNLMAILYGVGASIVIMGALFKITHRPGADLMLTVGLVTEAIIFFFSAFEPPYVDPDWSIVYPDLAHLYHTKAELKAMGLDPNAKVLRKGKPQSVTEELDHMLEDAKIEPELIESLGSGLKKLSEKAANLSDISDASVATNKYVASINEATVSASSLVGAYNQSTETMKNSSEVTNNYLSQVNNASQAISGLTDVYNETTEKAKNDSEVYNESLHAAANNLSSLNTAYEMQLKNADDYLVNIKKASKAMSGLTEAYTETSQKTRIDSEAYNESLNAVVNNLASLNSTYESQLTNSNEYLTNIKNASEAMYGLSEVYNETSQKTKDDAENYNDSIKAVKNNLSLLNATYEAQMQNVEKMQNSIENFVDSLNLSAQNTGELNQRVNHLNQKISALNGVYGNMLSAFNVKSNE